MPQAAELRVKPEVAGHSHHVSGRDSGTERYAKSEATRSPTIRLSCNYGARGVHSSCSEQCESGGGNRHSVLAALALMTMRQAIPMHYPRTRWAVTDQGRTAGGPLLAGAPRT